MVLTPRRLGLLALAVGALAGAPAGAGGGSRCADGGAAIGDLGIAELSGLSRFQFTGESRDPDGPLVRAVVFRGEPRILRVADEGPAAGRLREGDVLVGIDGTLITTREGSKRFANLTPGEPVVLQIRRDGRVQQVRVIPATRCADTPLWMSAAPPTAPEPPGVPTAIEPATPPTPAPRAAREPSPMPPVPPVAPEAPEIYRVELAPPAPSRETPERDARLEALLSRRGWLGIGIDCEGCHWQLLPGDSGVTWASHEYPTIYQVDPGSPAGKAGLQRGDVLTAMDGESLLSPAGSRRFGSLRPGQSVRWTYRRDGRVATTVAVAGARPGPMGEYARSIAALKVQLEQLKQMRQEQIAGEDMRRRMAELESRIATQSLPRLRRSEQPMRYSGSVGDADIEVKGFGNVVVTTDESTGELVIQTADATVRIKPGAPGTPAHAPRPPRTPRPPKTPAAATPPAPPSEPH